MKQGKQIQSFKLCDDDVNFLKRAVELEEFPSKTSVVEHALRLFKIYFYNGMVQPFEPQANMFKKQNVDIN